MLRRTFISGLVLAGAIVLAAIVAWGLASAGTRDEITARPGEATPAAPDDRAAESRRAPTPAAPVRARPFTEPIDPDLGDAPLQRPPNEGVRIVVTDGPGGPPVAHADVHCGSYLGAESDFRFGTTVLQLGNSEDAALDGFPPAVAAERRLRERGWHTRTGPDGVAIVPRASLARSVLARTGSKSALMRLDVREDSLTVALQPDLPCDVRVVQADGAPAPGIDVVMGIVRGGTTSFDERPTRSGPDGVAKLGNLRLLPFIGPGMAIACEARGVIAPDCRLVVPFESIEAERRRPLGDLRLPAMGRLLVSIVDRRGQPIQGRATVRVSLDARQRVPPRAMRTPVTRAQEFDAVEPILIPRIALGEPVMVEGRRAGLPSLRKTVTVTDPDEPLVVALRLPFNVVPVVGRLVDDASRPLGPEWRVDATVVTESGASATASARMLDDGAFTFPHQLKRDDPPRRVQFVVHRFLNPLSFEGEGSFTAPIPEDAAKIDLGTIVLAQIPVVAAGLVVDEDGEPVEGASVDVVRPDRAELTNEDGSEWTVDAELGSPTGYDGRFVLRGRMKVPTLRLRASVDGFTFEPVEVANGAKDVRLTVSRGVVLSGRLAPPSGFRPTEFTLVARVTPTRAERAVDSTRFATILPDGRFRFPPLPVGEATVYLRHENAATIALRVVDGVVLPKAGSVIDSRLDPLLVPAGFNAFTLNAASADGRPLSEVLVVAHSREAERVPRGVLDEHAPIDPAVRLVRALHFIFPDSTPRSFTVSAVGFRTQTITDVVTDRTVIVERGMPVAITVENLPPMKAGFAAGVTLELEGQSVSTSAPCDGKGVALPAVTVPGTYRVSLTLAPPRSSLFMVPEPVPLGSVTVGTVPPAPATFRLTDEQVKEILSSM